MKFPKNILSLKSKNSKVKFKKQSRKVKILKKKKFKEVLLIKSCLYKEKNKDRFKKNISKISDNKYKFNNK